MKVTQKQEVDIVHAYQVELVPMKKIAEQYGMTRQGVWRALKRQGANTKKGMGGASLIPVTCCACGKEVIKKRNVLRAVKRSFCNYECYYAYLEAYQEGQYQPHRQSQRIARMIVSRYVEITPKNIVHHEDRNNYNNHPSNLKAFKNQGDHILYHRGHPGNIYGIEPIWDGSTAKIIEPPSIKLVK